MRISDWSSDVCSSDLRHRGLECPGSAPQRAFDPAQVRLGADLQRPGFRRADVCAVAPARCAGADSLLAARALLRAADGGRVVPELGSASCGERVGTYV